MTRSLRGPVRRLAIAGLLVPGLLAAQRPIPSGVVLSGTLSFDGKATLGDFVGTTDSVRGVLVGGPRLAVVRGHVEAPVRTLATGNDRRDRDLNKSMESEQYPLIRFDLDSVTVLSERDDSARVLLHGHFLIHGVRRGEVIDARVEFGADGTLGLAADLPMNLKDYQIGGLSRVLGLFRMNPDIVVHIRLRFGPDAGAAAPAGAVPAATPPRPAPPLPGGG